MLGKAKKRLGADLDGRPSRRGIVDRVAAAGRTGELGRGQAVDRADRLIAEKGLERLSVAVPRTLEEVERFMKK